MKTPLLVPAAAMIGGYLVWLGLCYAVIILTPVNAWGFVAAAVFAASAGACWIVASRQPIGVMRTVLRWAPVLPGIAIVYLLAVFLT